MVSVNAIMRQPVVTIRAAESVAHAVREMQAHEVSCLLVEPRFEGEGYGIVTKADVVGKVVARGREPGRIHVSAVMTRPMLTVAPECSVRDCADLMLRHHVRRVPVLSARGEPLGIVIALDVFDALLHVRAEGAAPPNH
jgi:CBS domain-containing protein